MAAAFRAGEWNGKRCARILISAKSLQPNASAVFAEIGMLLGGLLCVDIPEFPAVNRSLIPEEGMGVNFIMGSPSVVCGRLWPGCFREVPVNLVKRIFSITRYPDDTKPTK